MPATCKVITLKGNPGKPESATHIIEFPGGSIEVSRTTDGDYWAHIAVNTGQVLDDANGYHGANGRIVGTRIDRTIDYNGPSVEDIPEHGMIQHLAVRIAVQKG